ncbi:Hypothetical predicted protein [Paramuricea clavata]|uniref:Uncharacterized protein n=1 Tax=Paramuricea clavata TaxID=317549 RepID=A0A6S7IGZ9_PARCT|nr:Hypothetical predicted protein [Paramuricea clavata]
MKSWTILALLVAICAVFLGVGHAEETADDFREAALEDTYSDTDENDVRLADSFVNRENDADDENDDEDDDESDGEDDDESDGDDETENTLESVKGTPSNDDEKPKRSPWWHHFRRHHHRRHHHHHHPHHHHRRHRHRRHGCGK